VSLNPDHNDKLAQMLNKSFESWDAGSPGDSLWDKLNGSLENTENTSLEDAFEQWDTSALSIRVWDKLNASLDKEVAENRNPGEDAQSLSAAFNNWNAEEPQDLWNKLDEELSASSVWDRLSVSLDEETDAVVDTKFKAAYEEWSTGTNHDGWTKLDDALSRERVWNRLAVTLTQPVALPSVWWKYAASLIAFTFISFFMNDGIHQNGSINSTATNSGTETPAPEIIDSPNNGGNNAPIVNPAQQVAVNGPGLNPYNNTNVIANNQDRNQHPDANNSVDNSANNPANSTASATQADNKVSADLAFDDLALLQAKGLLNTDNCANVGRTHFYEAPKSFLSATLAFGTQLSQSRNDNRSSLSSSAPRFGLAVDAAFSKHFGRWGLTQDFGYVQFTQLNGDYVKGRYQNSIQQLNTIQSTSGFFYSFNRIDVNGGIVFTRILNGLEQESNKIINVYNTNKIQTGLSAGMTYNFSPKRDKIRYGLGLQYQWIPNINAGTTAFRDVQGLKIQGKISF
jgi:hypothetical protein